MSAWFACTLAAKGMTFADVYKDLPLWEQRMVNIRLSETVGIEIADHPDLINEIEATKTDLGSNGRVIVRPSGTEPLLRVWAEARTPEQLDMATFRLQRCVHSLMQS